jgi:class 3 adenylate cyclase
VEVGPALHFCTSCGHRLEPSGTAVARDRVAREGERRTVTVLFADAVGSTPIAERIGEEEMYGLIQGCVKRMVEAVRHYEGHIAHFTGDGVMAVFGAPVAHEEAERRAVAAALRMQRALEEYASEVRQRHPVECHYRVGLNTGPVVVGSVSDDLDMDFTAIGDTVNLAARMQQMAEPGSAHLTESTYRAIADHVECEPLGELSVRGRSQPVRVWRALRERAQRSRLEVAVERGLAPFVGRDEELATLERHLERVRQGRGQVVFVSGDPGIGKSRLLLEFRRSLSGMETRWVQGQCTAFGRGAHHRPGEGAHLELESAGTGHRSVPPVPPLRRSW